MKLSVQLPDELIAAVPRAVGVRPAPPLVLVPFVNRLPTARIDLLTAPPDCDAATVTAVAKGANKGAAGGKRRRR